MHHPFAEAHADLLSRKPSILAGYYSDEALTAERAKRELVLPDREALPMALDVGAVERPGTAVVPC